MQTLIPQPVTVRARYLGRAGRVLGFGLSARALLLLIVGVLWAIPAFFHPHRIWLMLGWDGLIVLLIVLDGMRLPTPSAITVTRRFLHSPTLGERTEIEYDVVQQSNGIVTVSVTDDLHPGFDPYSPIPDGGRLSARCRSSCAGVLSGGARGFQAWEDLSSVSGCVAAGGALGRLRRRAGSASVSGIGAEWG